MDRVGSVDGIINCAGIIQPFVRLNDLEYAAIDRVMDVNFRGALYMTKTFLPWLLKRPETHIVNVPSMGDGGEGAGPGGTGRGASRCAGYTPGMKTAVSVPDDLFAQVDRLARRSHRSRSEVYSAALREYVARHAPDEVTAGLDLVVAEIGGAGDDRFAGAAARRTLGATEW